jgi:hypothetical protein
MSSPKRKFTEADLIPGQSYIVVKTFNDYDGIPHPVGERWRFVSKDFLPYEDGLTLYVERNGRTVPFRLQWRGETQGQIIDKLSDFVEEV